jgi:hypothetical protein
VGFRIQVCHVPVEGSRAIVGREVHVVVGARGRAHLAPPA